MTDTGDPHIKINFFVVLIFVEVKEHYMSRYLEGIIGKATWGGIQRPDFRGDNNISEPSTDLSRLPPLDCTLMEVYLLGYMPKRDDFDRVNIFQDPS